MPIFAHDPYDESLLRRIADAFTHSSSRAAEVAEDMWTINVASHQQLVYLLKAFQYREAA